ncbi:MAG: HD-GYP domain-containing protein [Dehalococcoidia bacterium]|nr:HD-GYP domain-containing protein [Dehalococcoidia bacterium]
MQKRQEQRENHNGLTVERPAPIVVRPEIGHGTHLPEREPREGGVAPQALPRQAAILSVATFIGGVIVLAAYAPQLPHSGLVGLVLFAVLAAISDRLGILVYSDSRVSVSFICLFAVSALYGPAGVSIAAPFTALGSHLPNNLFSYRFMFNAGALVIGNGLTAMVLWALIDPQDLAVSPRVIIAALAAATVTYGVNSFLVTSIASLATGQSAWSIWQEKFQWLFPHYVVFGLLGIAFALAYQMLGVSGLLAFAAGPIMMRLAIKQYVDKTARHVAALKQKNEQLEKANREILAMTRRLKETYDATLEALAAALDARDRETAGHSSRVTVYTMSMAERLGIHKNSDEWLDIERASLLHDVGKIGIADSILNKAGPLTPEEWQEMRRHPAIGYDMLKDVKFLSGAAHIVYAHHERYDGKGYPEGLKGDDIPLGARIFAVADAFDAMTSDRPYRRALPWDKAREEIVNNSGIQFDPIVVEAFLQCLEEWKESVEERMAA